MKDVRDEISLPVVGDILATRN